MLLPSSSSIAHTFLANFGCEPGFTRKVQTELNLVVDYEYIRRSSMRQLVLGLVIFCAYAQAGAQDSGLTFDRINLSVKVQKDIENDLLIASLFTDQKAFEQSLVAEQINSTMKWALKITEEEPAVQMQTTGFNMYPVNDRNNRLAGWRGRQGIRLQSTHVEKLTRLIGALQKKLAIESMTYGISKALRTTAEEGLIAEAINEFQKRAKLIVSQMDRTGYRVVAMNIYTQPNHSSRLPYQSRALAMETDLALETDIPAPVVQLGQQTLVVSISATIELDALQK